MHRALLMAAVFLFCTPLAARGGIEDAVIEACAGPTGQLRLGGEGCRPSERTLAWQRGGGVFVHDALGRPLGRSVDREGFFVRIYLDGLGLRVLLHGHRGTLPPIAVFFSEPDCEGIGLGDGTPGDLIAPTESGPLYVVTDRVLTTRFQSRRIGDFCQNLSSFIFDFREVVPFTGEPGFTLPVPAPLQFGTGPLGEIAEEFVHACGGARGELRHVEGAEACRPAERAFAWQRLGGLRVYDGLGRDVGAALGTNVNVFPTNVVGPHGIFLGESGIWIEPDPLTGALEEPELRAYAGTNCQGESFAVEGFPFASPAGKVFADSTPGAFVVTTPELVQDAAFRSVRSAPNGRPPGCQNRSGTSTGLRLTPYTGRLPTLPLSVPLVVGFPGSPVANPAGPALPAGLVHACAGPNGQLREVDEGVSCLRSERALRWPVRGGLRALDAHGNELGAFLERAASNVITETMRIIDDESGLRFGIRFFDGQLGQGVVPVELSFTEPGCQGTAFRFFESQVGQVFPFESRLLVGTRLAPLVRRSFRRAFAACEPRMFPTPVLSTVVEDFTGVVPFPLPVATPLLVGPGN